MLTSGDNAYHNNIRSKDTFAHVARSTPDMEDKSESSAGALNAILEDDEEKVWVRQSRMREVRRERDKLCEDQEADLARIRDASRADRLLCEAARDAGIVQASPEGSLNQAQLANALREQAGRAGIPYKGLATEELMAVIKQEAELRRGVLVDQVNHILTVLEATKERLLGIGGCDKVVEANCSKAEVRINDEVESLVDLVRTRGEQLLRSLSNARRAKLDQLDGVKAETNFTQTRLEDALVSANTLKTGNDLDFLTGYADMQNMLDQVIEQGSKWKAGIAAFPSQDIPVAFQPYAHEAVLSHGCIGDMLEDQSNYNASAGLKWDSSTCSKVLKVSSDGRSLVHSGAHDERAMGMSIQGFGSGTAVVRIRLSGLVQQQWIALGVTSPSKLNTASMITDSMIFGVDNTLATRLVYSLGVNGKGFQRDDLSIADEDVVTVAIDVDSRTVEYWRQGVLVKRNRFSVSDPNNHGPNITGSHGNREAGLKLHVFCILFHPGQEATLL